MDAVGMGQAVQVPKMMITIMKIAAGMIVEPWGK